MNVFLTGGSGLLGEHLGRELDNRGIARYSPSHEKFNVVEQRLGDVILWGGFTPDVVIHCAAVARYRDVEKDIGKSLGINVIGTCHLIRECIQHDIRMVYISTDHVFDGLDGPYGVDDKINPITKYAKTKAAGELAVRTYDNSLVIRTSFCPSRFMFDTAYTDKWTSQDYVDKVAPKILDKCLSDQVGVCHVGHPRRSFYDLAVERHPDIKKGSVTEIMKTSKVPILVDTSLK
jgi:dTDP-4-dehydrorhamnose reductase